MNKRRATAGQGSSAADPPSVQPNTTRRAAGGLSPPTIRRRHAPSRLEVEVFAQRLTATAVVELEDKSARQCGPACRRCPSLSTTPRPSAQAEATIIARHAAGEPLGREPLGRPDCRVATPPAAAGRRIQRLKRSRMLQPPCRRARRRHAQEAQRLVAKPRPTRPGSRPPPSRQPDAGRP